MLAIIAGEDKIANSEGALELLNKIPTGIVDVIIYPDNYHENFNELNREEVYKRILEWVEPRLGK